MNLTQPILNDTDYLSYRKVFLGWAIKKWSNIDEHIIEDIFHDSLVVFLKYQQEEKINVAPITFIIAVGNRLLSKRPVFQDFKKTDKPENPVNESDTHLNEVVRKGLCQLDPKCKEILIAKYYYQFSMDEIKEELGGASRDVIRTQKLRCMKKLKNIVKKMIQVG